MSLPASPVALEVMAAAAINEFRTQWTRPSDTFSVLLIVGGDVIQLTLANLTGGIVTPIAFSFGWVAYAVTAALGAMSNNRLISCAPEVSIKVFNLETSYGRNNQSWLLGRLFKTYDTWMPVDVRKAVDKLKRKVAATAPNRPLRKDSTIGLCVSVYTWSGEAGRPSLDYVWWSGLLVSAVQLGVAAVPLALRGNWAIFLAATSGTLLAYASASLPHWREEKFQARRDGEKKQKKHFALTRGQGSQHVIIVMDSETGGWGLDLEDLAGGHAPEMHFTRVWTVVLAALWMAFLITCTGIVSDTWYLLAVGALGMLHNLVAAGVARRPQAMGFPVTLYCSRNEATGQQYQPQIFAEKKVMWTLMELEMIHKGFGKALLSEFFPGPLRAWEKDWWWGHEQNRRGKLDEQKEEDRKKLLAMQVSNAFPNSE